MIKLKDVRINQVEKRPSFNPFFFDPQPPEEPKMWIVTFHKEYKKWIITNHIDHAGLGEKPELIQIIAYATDINNALFAIYEHQKSLGTKRTIMDEIREQKSVRASGEAWAWGREDERAPIPNLIQEMLAKQQEMNRMAPIAVPWTFEEWKPYEKPKKSWKFWKK